MSGRYLPTRLPFGRPARAPLALLPDRALAFLALVVRDRRLRTALEAEAALREGCGHSGPRLDRWSPV